MKQFALTGLAAVSLTLATGTAAEAFTITLDGQWYEISLLEADPEYDFYDPSDFGGFEAQPWYGSEELAKSAAAQVADAFGALNDPYAVVPGDETLSQVSQACFDYCNGPLFAWDVFYQAPVVGQGPDGPIYYKSSLMTWVATYRASDSDFKPGFTAGVDTEKRYAGYGFYAIAEATDAPETVPEPGTLIGLAALGLLGLATRKRSA